MTDNEKNGSVFEQLRKGAESFSPQQRNICSYILDHYRETVFMTVEELAQVTRTSPATVVRTSWKLGFQSFPEFKDALKNSMLSTLPSLWWQMEESWTEKEGLENFQSIIDANRDGINALLTPNIQESFPRSVRLLNEARNVYVLAMRSTRAASIYFYSLAHQFLTNVRLADHSGSEEMFAELVDMRPEDVFLAITVNGPHYAARTIDAVRYAHYRKVPTILITTELTCPAVPYATEVLCVPPVQDHYTLVPIMTVLDALISEIGQERKDEGTTKLRELERILTDTRITL